MIQDYVIYCKQTMGIKNLSKFLRTKCPEIYEDIHISEYHFRKIAIDTSIYLCNYKVIYSDPNNPKDMSGWLAAFIRLVACLRENEVHCVFIYDSGSPPEKAEEKAERAKQRDKLAERIGKLEEAVEIFRNTGEITPYLLEFQNKRKIRKPRMLRPNQFTVNIGAIEHALHNMKKQLFSITPADIAATKKLFDILDVPYFDAPMEAETMCADLCIQGKVDAVLSEDTDVMTYGTPVFLTKFDPRNGTCKRVVHKQLLENLELTNDEFVDFCIMCGTDYNKNIFRVGPNKAYKYICEHRTIEKVDENTKLDVSILKHVRGRELFKNYERSTISVPYCGQPDFNVLQQFLFKKNVQTDMNALRKSFVQNVVVFEEDSDDSIAIIDD